MVYNICENCGAYLDPHEACDCTAADKKLAEAVNEIKEKHPVQNRVSLF